MKKRSIAMMLLMSMAIVACGGAKAQTDNTNKTEAAGDTVKDGAASGKKAILIINGNLGDLGFFDSANRGMERLKNELGMDVKVVETGDDEAKWEPALADAADEPVDYVIAVSPSMVEPMQKLAPDYPEKKFILIDNVVDFQAADLSNVYCATFKQNEGSFLAGAAAGLSVEEGGTIGFIGGMDIPPINDFLVGYIEGAQSVNSGVKVISTYTGDYYDPAKGKEHAIVQFNQGVGVVFAAAGPAGLGSIEAATEQDKKIIGVDSDQSTAYENKGDKKTAVIKDVRTSFKEYCTPCRYAFREGIIIFRRYPLCVNRGASTKETAFINHKCMIITVSSIRLLKALIQEIAMKRNL